MTVARLAILALLALITTPRPSDEIVAVADACGKPLWIRRTPLRQLGADASAERLHYASLDLIFQRDKVGDRWSLDHATRPGSDARLAGEDARKAMPCLAKAGSSLSLLAAKGAEFPSQSSTPTAPLAQPAPAPQQQTHSPLGMIGIVSASMALLGAFVLYVLRRPKNIDQGAGWLCMNCYTISEPAESDDGELRCSVCSYGTPVPFESAEAKEYFTASGFKPRVSP
jgi:hypothetical protein